MAKDGSGKQQPGNRRSGKLPKRIGGVRLPKKARKQANKAIAALDQPMVRALAAMALAAAAKRAAPPTTAGPAAPAGVKTQPPHPQSTGAQLGQIAAGVAIAALGTWLSKRGETDEGGAAASAPEAGSTH